MAEEMIYIPMRYRVDLDRTINTTPLNTLFAMGDNQAHRFELTITHGSVAEDLTGCEVKGKFVSFSNNMTVILTGSVEDGNAVVALKQPCYTQLGRFALTIQIHKNGAKTTVFYGDGYMRNTSTDNAIIDEDYIVYDTDVLLSKIQEIENAISGANEAISGANAAADGANTSAQAASNAADAANAAADRGDTAIQAANTAAANAESKAAAADAATAAANTAADGANASADLANTAAQSANAAAENAMSSADTANAAASAANAAAENVDANMDAKITARVDKTLSVENGIADAKKVGDEIGSLKDDLDEIEKHISQKNILDAALCSVGEYVNGKILTDSNYTLQDVYINQEDTYILSPIIKCKPGEKYTINRESYPVSRTIYFGDKNKKGVNLAKYEDCVVSNDDGTWTFTVPINAYYFRWGFAVNQSGWENQGWKTKAMICKGESLNPSFIDNRYLFEGVDVVEMSEKLESVDNDFNIIKNIFVERTPVPFSEIPTEGNYVLKANVGGNIEKVYNQYRTLYKMKVNKNASYFLTNIQTLSSDANVWVLVDKNEKAISVGSYGNYNTGAFVKGNENAEYLYFTALNDVFGYVYQDNGKFEVYKGVNIGYTSVVDFKNNGNSINDTDIVTINTSESFDLTFTATMCNTIGLWLKVPYFELDNLSSIKLEAKKNGTILKTSTLNKTNFEHGTYLFFKMLVCDEIDSISVTPNCSSAIDIELSDVLVINQFTRPYLCINFDNAWQQSNDCGAYDFLINNNIPFTITGSLENIDSDTRQKLLSAHAKGLLDIGCYGNEQYDGVSYSVTNEISDYATLENTMCDLLTKKLSYCQNPISFGPRQHKMTPVLRKCITNNGFKISRYSPNNANADIDLYNSLFDKSLIVLSEFGFNNSVRTNLIGGGGTILFAHGLSANPSGEDYPSNYSQYRESYMNEILRLRDEFGMMIINMKQLYELIS